jgi:hypothetical protein
MDAGGSSGDAAGGFGARDGYEVRKGSFLKKRTKKLSFAKSGGTTTPKPQTPKSFLLLFFKKVVFL